MKKIIPLIMYCIVNFTMMHAQQQHTIPLTTKFWKPGNTSEGNFTTYNDREAVKLNGSLFLDSENLEEGIFSTDIFCDNQRSFGGILFHDNQNNAEEIYIRKHKSGQIDALQYTPVFNGESNWQLYPEYQAKVTFIQNQWNTLTIKFNQRQANVYINNKLVLEITELQGTKSIGKLGLWSLFPVWFSNIKLSKEKVTFENSLKKDKIIPKGIIYKWQLSQSFPIDSLAYYQQHPTAVTYNDYKTDSNGLLAISKYITKKSQQQFEANQEEFVIAKVSIESDSTKTMKLFFNYSDKCFIQLNGNEEFYGNNQFRLKGIQYMGHLNMEANCLFLPLKKGTNQLLLFVVEKANGWGLCGRLEK